jgi:ATP-dependent DNA ligase
VPRALEQLGLESERVRVNAT